MVFTQNWFNDVGRATFEALLKPLADEHINYLEVGCFEGMATKWVLENIPNAKVTVIDTFSGGQDQNAIDFEKVEERFTQNILPWINRVNIRKGLSENVLTTLVEEFDVIYIDGSHLAADVLSDMVLSWRLLKKNGIMIMDDYDWSHGDPKLETPKIAVDSFLQCYEGKYKVLHIGYQLAIQKL